MAINPVDTSSFTPAQLTAFQSAASLGGGVPTYNSAAPLVTLPSIPNPTPPPPQTLTVITPSTAQKDLSAKQSTVTGVDAAATAQTQSKLATMQGTQPVVQGTQQNTQDTQQQAPQGTQAATPTGTQTAQPNTSPVTLPNGTQANYNASTGALTTADGKQLSWNAQTNAWIDPATGQPPVPGATAAPQTGDPTTDYVTSQLAQNQATADAASAQHQQQVSQILNGTFPLTSDQQAQVVALQAQFDQLKALQQTANDNYVGATTTLGIRSGRNQYAPELAHAEINTAVNAGIQKIAQIDSQAQAAVSTLKQGFLDNDYKIINQAYADLQDSITQKNATLTAMQDAVQKQVQMQTEKIQQQSASLALQTTQINNVAQAALSSALKLDGSLDLDVLQQIADDQGIDPNALYGAVVKAQQDETTFQQGESKFASDQLQAAASLANTKANTAKTYQDIEKAKSTINDAGDTVQSLAQALVNGTLAPSELSKRTTGTASYNDVLTAAQKINPKFSIAQADRDYKFANNVNTQNTLNYLGSLVGGNGEKGNLDDLESLSNSINRTSFPALNDAAGWARLQTGDPAITAYYATATEVADQVAKILQGGGTGSGTSDAKLQQATALFQSSFSKAQLSSTIDALRPLLQNRAQSIVGDNPYLSDYAEQFGVTNKSDASQSPAVGTDGTAFGFPGYHSDGTQWVPNK